MAARPHLEDDETPPLLDALEKLRWRLIKIAVAIFVGFVIGFALAHYTTVTEVLVRPIRPFLAHQGGRLAALSPMTPFLLEIKVALVIAVMLALPVILYQVWGHFSPILMAHERRLILPSLFAAVVLFAVGVVAGYLVLPISLRWAFSFQTDYVTAVINADDYFSFATRLLLAFGVVFEMPIVLMILTTLGIVTPEFLKRTRRHAVVGIAVLSAFITPGDIASMFLMMVPMVVLYELSILLTRLISRPDPAERLEEAEA